MRKHVITTAILSICALSITSAHGYSIGLKSRDNTIENIQRVEKTVGVHVPIVSFIFDPRDESAFSTIANLPRTLGTQRIYHITVSPRMTAKDVAAGKSDEMYTEFFKLVKTLKIRVVFRTMHEMNGGRYTRSSDPASFIKARQHIRQLSRDVGLTKEFILFDMSVNGRDIPTRDAVPTQSSKLFYCYPAQKKQLKCPTFEDYYPGDDYVDLMGMTFYNRGKAQTNRLRQSPYDIIENKQRHTLSRIKTFKKPLFIDEVGTTAVRYNEKYNQAKSQAVFANETKRKDDWLDSLRLFLINEPEIVGTVYFNVDLTNGLQNWMMGEADRSVFDPGTNKIYEGGRRLFENATDNDTSSNPLLETFGLRHTLINNKLVFISKRYGTEAVRLLDSLHITTDMLAAESKNALAIYQKKVDQNTTIKMSQKTRIQHIIDEASNIISQ